jgi:DNA-binding transcriptional ArsR family regulator
MYLDIYLNIEGGMDKLFKALNDPTRRRILELLRQQDMTAGAIADCFQISKPSISHHLDLLKQADLILSEKNGQFITYSLNTSVLDECLSWLMELSKHSKKGTQHETRKSEKRVASTGDSDRAVLRRRPALG